MTIAEQLAQYTRERYGSDPWTAASKLGLVVTRDRLPAAHREVYFAKDGICGVIVSDSVNDQDARELLAHGIGHHLLHVGDRVSGQSPAVWSGRHEREARDFAACLLVDGRRLALRLGEVDPAPPAVLAEDFGVSADTLDRRIALLGRSAHREPLAA